MNSLPYHPPAGGRDPPVKRSQHPAREHGVSGGGGRKPAGHDDPGMSEGFFYESLDPGIDDHLDAGSGSCGYQPGELLHTNTHIE